MKFLVMLAALMLVLTLPSANAVFIDQAVANPQDGWLGDPVTISVRCMPEAEAVTEVKADISGPGIIIPNLALAAAGDNMYQLSIPGSYFDRKGNYTAAILCKTETNETSASAAFSLSEVAGSITYITSPIFTGGGVEINYDPEKNGEAITAGITFSVSINGAGKDFTMPPMYDVDKGWVLHIAAPAAAGTHNLAISAGHNGKTISSSMQITAKAPIEFSISSVDKTNMKEGETISMGMLATNYGSAIPLDGIIVKIANTTAEIKNIAGNQLQFTAPSLEPGRYNMTVSLVYNGTNYTSTKAVDYVTIISGKFLDAGGRPISAQLRFLKNGAEKLRVSTLSDGSYSAQIIPDTYDVMFETDIAKVILNKAEVNSFEDAFEYVYDSGAKIEGFASNGVYRINTDWKFELANITLSYGDLDGEINVFKCTDFSSGACSKNWSKLLPQVLAAQKRVVFSVLDLGTFAAGSQDRISISMTFDKEEYAKRDVVKIRGSASGLKGQVPNATVKITIESGNEAVVKTDKNGMFSADILGPGTEGTFAVKATANRYPYIGDEKSFNIEVVSMPSFSVIFPSTIRVAQGSNVTEGIKIVNTGQKDLTGVRIMTDLDDIYCEIGSYPPTLKVKEELNIAVTFHAGNENATTMAASFVIKTDQLEQEKQFGFTILERQAGQDTAATGMAIANPLSGIDLIYILIFAAAAFGAAFAIKKIRSREKMPPYRPLYLKTGKVKSFHAPEAPRERISYELNDYLYPERRAEKE